MNSDFTRQICTGHAVLGICAAPIAKLCLLPYSSARQSSLSSGFGGRSGAFAQGFRAQALGVLDFQPLRAQGSRVLDVGVLGLSLGSLGLNPKLLNPKPYNSGLTGLRVRCSWGLSAGASRVQEFRVWGLKFGVRAWGAEVWGLRCRV